MGAASAASIELRLAHAPRNAVSAAYNHALYLEPRARMMQGRADCLEQTTVAEDAAVPLVYCLVQVSLDHSFREILHAGACTAVPVRAK
jgi:hypothetical protein